jgi:hypothetical protein
VEAVSQREPYEVTFGSGQRQVTLLQAGWCVAPLGSLPPETAAPGVWVRKTDELLRDLWAGAVDQGLWQGSIEPPPEVTRIREFGGAEAIRGGPCAYCGGSMWNYVAGCFTAQPDPRPCPTDGLDGNGWNCWMDLDLIPPAVEVRAGP